MPANFNTNIDEAGYGNAAGYGGAGFGGGSWIWFLFVIVLWFLFKDGRRDGYSDGYGHDGGCGVKGCRPAFYDESNYEQDYKAANKFDRVYDKECEIEKTVYTDGAATRALIEANYIQDLRDKLSAANTDKAILQNQIYSDSKFASIIAAIGHTDREIDKLSCESLKRPPTWGCAAVPCNTTIETGCGGPRRGRCNDFDDRF
jgi:hypothetical protein